MLKISKLLGQKIQAAYPDVKVWKDHQVLTLKESFDADVVTYIEQCQDKEYYPALYLSPHGLTLGTTSLPIVQGFAQTHKPVTDI